MEESRKKAMLSELGHGSQAMGKSELRERDRDRKSKEAQRI